MLMDPRVTMVGTPVGFTVHVPIMTVKTEFRQMYLHMTTGTNGVPVVMLQ